MSLSESNRFTLVSAAAASAEGRCSEAIWIVLEKLGFADFDRRVAADTGPIVAAPGRVIIVTHAALLTADVTPALIDQWRNAGATVFLEGPWPSSWDAALGASIDRAAGPRTDAGWVIRDEALEARVHAALDGMKNPSASGAYEGPASLVIRDRSRSARRQSEHQSAFADVNLEAATPSWFLRPSAPLDDGGLTPLLSWRREGGVDGGDLLYRGENLLVSSWAMLSYLAQDYTAPALHHSYEFSSDRYPLEFVWMSLLLDGLRAADPTAGSVRLAPWPDGAQYALTIRHDVDRRPRDPEFGELLEAEERAGVGVSCYFLGKTAEPETIRRFAEIGAEIAWHSEHLEPDAAEEIEAIAQHVAIDVVGSTVHGPEGYYGWRGAANWEVAERLDFDYAEHLSSMRYWPSRVFRLDDEGGIRPYPFIALPHHVSLDAKGGAAYREELIASLPALARNGMYVTILNHPDINVPALIELLDEHVPEGAVGLTAQDAALWWRATHLREHCAYAVRSCSAECLELDLDLADAVPGLTFELSVETPPTSVRIDGEPADRFGATPFATSAFARDGWRVSFDAPAGSSRVMMSWSTRERAMERLHDRILAWFDAGTGAPARNAEKTAAFNTVDVERRLSRLLAPAAARLADPNGIDVLDVGCGFGGPALFLASGDPSHRVTAIDVSDRFFVAGKDTAAELGLEQVRFEVRNVLELDDVEAYDLVLASNVLNYLLTPADLERACGNLWRALRPGGLLAVYTPHRGSWREPFTKLPMVHWLPAGWRERMVARSGGRGTLKDVRLPSARELRRIFRRAGARSIRQTPGRAWRRLRTTHLFQWIEK